MITTDEIKGWGSMFGVFLLAALGEVARRRSRDNSMKLDGIHTLVNSSMGKQLRLTSVMAQRIAELTKDPKDISAAQQAIGEYEAYLDRQEKFDKGSSS